ncbi:uncharacterized protein LOC119693719 [Plutella xylostella]|uniref:uncharacterized protein LOC119693719 n=1 Tax=Plutella xylostella TaxID=51655 RepID=UPI0020328865|nr:uncharacterized protein LOC119693719 [Plutella xylostella]
MQLLALLTVAAAAAAAPVLVDQRQDGDLNFQADVKNVVLIVALPQQKAPASLGLQDLGLYLNGLTKSADGKVQERGAVRVLEAFVEPPTPYRVEIGGERAGGEGRTVTIAGRRAAVEAEAAAAGDDELKLLGATEQCGPGRRRDPASLACRDDPAPPAPPAAAAAAEEPQQPTQNELDIKSEKLPESV